MTAVAPPLFSGDVGRPRVDVAVWWVQQAGHDGARRKDFIWTSNVSGLKILSHRMVDVLRQ